MKKLLLILILVLISDSLLFSQTPRFNWIAPDNSVSSVEAQSFIYTLYVNDGTGLVLSDVTCTGAVPTITCLANVPTTVPLLIGTRYELTAKSTTSAESLRSIPFIMGPNAPTSFRIR